VIIECITGRAQRELRCRRGARVVQRLAEKRRRPARTVRGRASPCRWRCSCRQADDPCPVDSNFNAGGIGALRVVFAERGSMVAVAAADADG